MKALITKSFSYWLPLMLIGMINGIMRGLLIARYSTEATSRQISSVLMIIWILAYVREVCPRMHLRKSSDALMVGVYWVLFTMVFEFMLGATSGLTLRQMLQDYNLFEGRLWSLVLLALLISPPLIFSGDQHGKQVQHL